jgi:multidrug efflux pump subunit AcrA (membrane-fusion protein)
MKKISFSTILALVFGIVLSACSSNPGTSSTEATPTPGAATVIAAGHLVPNRSLYLAFQVPGHVTDILVHKGDQVTPGQVLAHLGDSQQAEAGLVAAQLELTSAQQAYDSLIRTADLVHAQAWQAYINAQNANASAQLAWDSLDQNKIQTDIDNAQADMTSRSTDLENARKDLAKYSNLPASNPTRKTYEDKLRTAQTNYDQAIIKVDQLTNQRDSIHAALQIAQAAETEAKRNFENTQNGPNTDTLALARARLDNAKAQVATAQYGIDNYELTAPFVGTIEDINISVNQMVGPTTWVFSLADTSTWYVDTSDLGELDVVKLNTGQAVTVTADALPGITMPGVVESISRTPTLQTGDILYTVHIRMDAVDPNLRWGMTMEVTFPPNK